MKNINITIVDGNLTNDPELLKTVNGKSLCKFSIAVHNGIVNNQSNSDDVSYFDVDVWDKFAETCNDLLKKGSKAVIVGKLKQERWKAEDGTSRQKVKIIAQEIRFDSSVFEKKVIDNRKIAA
ncbi:MAG: single-stranded DNA-binding protein [Leptospiraceae bacterium]|nr:single-stranded DNA-binding protein [Leptospiraceae bacterium]MCP5494089.1 single-stranded DNA-binding protein [Leptospiraceae bacterium]